MAREHWRTVLTIDVAVNLPAAGAAYALWSGGATSMGTALVTIVAFCVLLAWLALPVQELDAGRPRPRVLVALEPALVRFATLLGVGLVYAAVILAGMLAYGVPAVIAAVWLAFVVPAVVLDGRRAEGAFRRSFSLVRGHAWDVFGLVLVNLLLFIVVFAPLLLALSPLDNTLEWLVAWFGALLLVSPIQAMSLLFAFLRLRDEKDAEPEAVRGKGATIERPA
jgi:hypothetical protein